MKLSDFMREDLIILELIASQKEAVIKEMIPALCKGGFAGSEKSLAKAILDREALGSTAIGSGVAIPHAKASFIKEKAIVFGRSTKGVDFNSIDGKPVNLFFMIVSPDTEAGPHLKMLARLSRLLQESDFRESLMSLSTAREIISYICAKEAGTIK